MKTYLFLAVFFLSTTLYAFHYSAGEITYTQLSGNTYEFRINIYTDTAGWDDSAISLNFGDGTSDMIADSGFYYILDSSVYCRYYIGTHTYAGPGIYVVSCSCNFRNSGVVNIPNSANVPLTLESQLVINPLLGANTSVVFNTPGLDFADILEPYTYYSNMFDADGDSIVYQLIPCIGVAGYSTPMASNIFQIDDSTGDVLWDVPMLSGDVNFAVKVSEWREGINIGYVIRDIQIRVGSSISTETINTEMNELDIYPNPATEVLHIGQQQSTIPFTSFELYDITGKLYVSNQLENEQWIDIRQLATGLYFLRLIHETGTMTTLIVKE